MYDYLSNAEDGKKADYCMAGYLIENTVTENGTVSRGIYSADKDGNLASIVERTKIRPKGADAEYTEDRPEIVKAMAEKTAAGLYPEKLW